MERVEERKGECWRRRTTRMATGLYVPVVCGWTWAGIKSAPPHIREFKLEGLLTVKIK